MTPTVFTSESVTDGHPDKLCDQISDAIVDHFLRDDPYASVIAECAVAKGLLFIAARFASRGTIDLPDIARRIIRRVGYEGEGFNARDCSIMTSLSERPLDDAARRDEKTLGDDEIERIPARNPVNAFGFACSQTASLMPLPIDLAHKLARRLAEARRNGDLSFLTPDGKTQVGVEYRDHRPVRIHSVSLVAAVAAEATIDEKALAERVREAVVEPVFADEEIRPDARTDIDVNRGGMFRVGGPVLHAGMTGRKNGIDTYGDYSRSSSAALSGKDPSRIDRVAAYAARHAAKNVVAAGLADTCEVHIGYSFGRARPVGFRVNTFGTGRIPDAEIGERVRRHLDFRPAGVIAAFGLRDLPAQSREGFYSRLAVYGHMGRADLDVPWERTDKVDALRD